MLTGRAWGDSEGLCLLFCQEASEAFEVRSCWEHLLGHTPLFDGVTKVYRTGDTAGHFQNYSMAHWESWIKQRFKIDRETVLLCPKHAANPCDPRGGLVNDVTFRAQSAGAFTKL